MGREGESPDRCEEIPLHEREPERASLSPYTVKLDVFEGPLDLLLHLIKQEQVSIYDIPIARITEQYLDYLRRMEALDLTIASEYLVMAATLIYIKSKMLLPAPARAADEAEAEDPRQELVRRLLEYQKYKAAAELLWSRAEREQATFTRGRLETDETNPEVNATVFDLFRAFQRAMERLKERQELVIAREQITLAEKIAELRALFRERERVDITALFEAACSRRELLILFLAVLELVRVALIRLVQTERFGRILALRASDVDPEAEATALRMTRDDHAD
ncbi:Segregation and condensation protein A [bacterium HR08]|nr:Segregation and condensation protein A [bacterium HR08]